MNTILFTLTARELVAVQVDKNAKFVPATIEPSKDKTK